MESKDWEFQNRCIKYFAKKYNSFTFEYVEGNEIGDEVQRALGHKNIYFGDEADLTESYYKVYYFDRLIGSIRWGYRSLFTEKIREGFYKLKTPVEMVVVHINYLKEDVEFVKEVNNAKMD